MTARDWADERVEALAPNLYRKYVKGRPLADAEGVEIPSHFNDCRAEIRALIEAVRAARAEGAPPRDMFEDAMRDPAVREAFWREFAKDMDEMLAAARAEGAEEERERARAALPAERKGAWLGGAAAAYREHGMDGEAALHRATWLHGEQATRIRAAVAAARASSGRGGGES